MMLWPFKSAAQELDELRDYFDTCDRIELKIARLRYARNLAEWRVARLKKEVRRLRAALEDKADG